VTKLRTALLGVALVMAGAPALADVETSAGERAQQPASVPAQLTADQRDAYRAIFSDLHAANWTSAAQRLDAMRPGPLHDYARALLYTLPGSPRVEAQPLLDLLTRARELPQAPDLARIAALRGATDLPPLPQAQRLVGLPGQPRRARGRAIVGDPVADALDPLISPLLVQDQPQQAETLFRARSEELSEEARTAFLQKIAWVYYLDGEERDARRLAEEGSRGPTEWAIMCDWVAGLAAWRMSDFDAAARSFASVASRSSDYELAAAGHFWASRADVASGHPERAQGRLEAAARLGETFYGLLAQSALGIHRAPAPADPFTSADWRALQDQSDVRIAVALAEIGEDDLAGDTLRYQARIGEPGQHPSLVRLAARLNLTSAQMWLAHNGPRGARAAMADRYPSPSWRPAHGWRVDRALVFAHALQESGFRPEAVSAAGARGLFLVGGGSASAKGRGRGVTVTPAQLNDPVVNIEYGQAYLEYLRDQSCTQGLLPKVIASYNAGPAPVAEWNTRYDQSDPLLYMESLPYWETRGYVPIVLRNYWVYEDDTADASASRRALVQGLWPRFPGLPGPTAVRISPRAVQTAMGSQ
jgi:soluble lytic murein transglycosylase-like protein